MKSEGGGGSVQPYHFCPIRISDFGRWGIIASLISKTSMARCVFHMSAMRAAERCEKKVDEPAKCPCRTPSQVGASAGHPRSPLVSAARKALHRLRQHTFTLAVKRECEKRTDNRLACALLDFEHALPVANEEGEVEHVLDGLAEVVWVYDELEEIRGALDALQNGLDLCIPSL